MTTRHAILIARLPTAWPVLAAWLMSIAAAGLAAVGPALAQPANGYVLQDVRASLKKKTGLPLDIRSKADDLEKYYARGDAKILWSDPARCDELMKLLPALSTVLQFNSDQILRRLEVRKQALRSEDSTLLALVELTFSAQLFDFAKGLRLGQMALYRDKLHKRSLERFIHVDRLLSLVADGKPLDAIVSGIEPKQKDYLAIRAKLLEYEGIYRRGGWVALRPGPDLKADATDPRVAALRDRLMVSGQLAPSAGKGNLFDAALTEAVKRFQTEHNLPASGVVDRRTLLALNVPVQDRITQLTANLERWRWFDDLAPGEQWVISPNSARVDVRLADGARELIRIKSDSGCLQSFSLDSEIGYVEINPSFTLPQVMAVKYVLPVLQQTPAALDPGLVIYAAKDGQSGTQVDWRTFSEADFPFSVVQSPGPANVLGSYRMALRDEPAAALHGQPEKSAKPPIPRSAWPSCVGVQALSGRVQSLLRDAGLTEKSSGEPRETLRVALPSAIPVIFIYETVWLDAGGSVVFGPDPLGQDAVLSRKLMTQRGS